MNELPKINKTDLTLKELINFKLDRIQTSHTAAYYQETKWFYEILLDSCRDKAVKDVSKTDILKLLNDCSESMKLYGKSNYYDNSMIKILKQLFNTAIIEFGIDIKNPFLHMKSFPIARDIKFIPTNEMIEAVLLICDELEQLLILFLLETGARLNEALRLTDKDISPGEKIVLYTRKSKYHNLTARTLSFPLCLKGVDFTGRLFECWTEPPTFLKKKIRKLGQPMWSLHSLRHRFAGQLLARREPLFSIMEKLGISSLANTQIYLHNVL